MGLKEYREKRDPRKTPEPFKAGARRGHRFVIQKHDASHLHYDFRLELDGTLKSWAVPKGPSLDPSQKRLAIQVEDHPISYATFEGVIPKGEYGGGEVIVWDAGNWTPVKDPHAGFRKGRLEFKLDGEKLHGEWVLFRIRGEGERAQWMLVKRHDRSAHATPDPNPIVEARPESVLSHKLLTRDMKARGARKSRSISVKADVWSSNRKTARKEKKKPARKTAARSKKRAADPLKFVEPELATLVEEPPTGDRWFHEIKFDGYRTLARLREGEPPVLRTRKGLDWTEKYPGIVEALAALPAESALIDGEIVALDEKGRSDFSLLQLRLKTGEGKNLVYYVFDLLELDGEDLRPLPLAERKERLAAFLKKRGRTGPIRYSDHWQGEAERILEKGCEIGLEGVISKDRDAPYSSGRSGQWLKSKCRNGQEVVIVGYTPPSGSRVGFGSLVLAARESDREEGTSGYRYLGRIGTGFDREKIATLLKRMKPLVTKASPFANRVPLHGKITWLKPKLVAEIEFHGWTREGHIRQGVFKALREDKPASEIVVEREKPVEEAKEGAVKLTHPDKVLIPETKVTKRQVRDYLVAVADWIAPHLLDRPLALVRCPDGTHGECFFQKKLLPGKNEGLKAAKIAGPKGKTAEVIGFESAVGLETLAQLGVLEIHPWGTHLKHPLKPDLIVFDLDPDAGVPWKKIAAAALRLKEVLEGLGLRSFVKLSGNKGLHLHVPIEPEYDWDTVKNFANAVALMLVEEEPEAYVATMTKAKRKGKIFIDFFRNGYGATSVAPYSMRSKNGGTVAMPIDWKEVKTADPQGFHLADATKALARKRPGGRGDPWREYFRVRQRLPKLKN